jgi:hypothetical protein
LNAGVCGDERRVYFGAVARRWMLGAWSCAGIVLYSTRFCLLCGTRTSMVGVCCQPYNIPAVHPPTDTHTHTRAIYHTHVRWPLCWRARSAPFSLAGTAKQGAVGVNFGGARVLTPSFWTWCVCCLVVWETWLRCDENPWVVGGRVKVFDGGVIHIPWAFGWLSFAVSWLHVGVRGLSQGWSRGCADVSVPLKVAVPYPRLCAPTPLSHTPACMA